MKCGEMANELKKYGDLEIVTYDPIAGKFIKIETESFRELLLKENNGMLEIPDLLNEQELKNSKKYLAIS